MAKKETIAKEAMNVANENANPVVNESAEQNASSNKEDVAASEETDETKDNVEEKGWDKIPEKARQYPKHITALYLIVVNNKEIKRFTALGIINYLKQKGHIDPDKKAYVEFYFNKFSVKVDGLIRQYAYTEAFFINALVSAFPSFSNSAQKTIEEFCNIELNKTLGDIYKK